MKKPIYLFIPVLFVLLSSALMADGFSGAVKKGNAAFQEGDFKKALDFYHQAEVERPETPELQYNIGSALYKEGKYEEAVDKLQKSFVTTEINNEAKAHYNLGNVYYKMGDYQKAIESYQKSLEKAPDDLDAKYNLELARVRLKEQLKPEQKQQQQQQQQNQKQDQQQNQQQEQEKHEQEKQEQKQQQDQQQAQEKPQHADPNDMTKEDAERILNALKDDEKEVQKDVHRLQGAAASGGKDW